MKRLFCFLTLALAFIGNAMAWEPVIREIHYFGMYYPDSYEPVESSEINCFSSNGYTHDLNYMKFKNRNQPNTPKVTFRSWTDNSKTRFALNNPDNWEFNKTNSTYYPGPGLYNKSDNATNVWIRNLDSGDKFILEYYRNGSTGDFPKFVQSNNGHNSGTVTGLSDGTILAGTQEYTCTSGGDVCISMPSKVVIRSLTIIHANYQTATHRIDPITDNGNKGYRYTLTGPGVLEDKKGAVPYITMRFGHDNDMTFVRDLGNGNYGASCIVDQTDNLNLDDPNVRLSAAYKKRYINKNGQYSTSMDDVNGTSLSQEEQAAIKERAQKEANMLKGREWTVFEADNEWDDNIDWNDNRTHKKEFKWGDDFNSIYPLYGTYFYFFPEVKGKFRVKFYCEGNEEHMPLWYKQNYKKDANGDYLIDENGKKVPDFISALDVDHPELDQHRVNLKVSYDGGRTFAGILHGANNKDDVTIYEYTADMEKDGVYYLCANPTIVGREHPIVRLISYEFIPEFRVDPLYNVVNNGTQSVSGAATIKGVTIREFTGVQDNNVLDNNETININGEDVPIVRFRGRVNGAKVSLRQDGDNIKLDFSDITYKAGADINQGGAIIVNLNCPAGKATFVLTIAYKAAKAEWGKDTEGNDLRVATKETGNVEVKRWDFYSGKGEYGDAEWELGKYSNTNSKLYKEVHKLDGLTTDWVDDYVDQQNKKERIFKSVYDMEGDNADMIKETEGLVFHTDANKMGIFNENPSPSNGFQDRYIGLMNGSKLVIPRLQAGDRVVIKMGSFGNADDAVTNKPATLTLTNAKDAKGTDISGDYVIGGSIPYEGETDPHGEYHFMVKETSNSDATDFALEVKNADILKIYSIVIYRNAADNNAEILTENQLIGEQQEVTFTDDDASTAEKTLDAHVRYHGYQEKSDFDNVDQLRGNLAITKDKVTVTTSDEEPYCTISTTVKKGNFGSFRAKMQVLTKDANNTYVTDYVPGGFAVGLLEKVKDGYPYTWDFTDLLKLEYNNSTYIHDAIDNEKAATNLLSDYKGWEAYNGQSLRNAPKNASGILFADGGQLYATNEMFKETAGIGFKRSTDNVEDAKLLNRSVRIRDNALVLNCNEEGKFHKMVLPKVDADAVIYVRATPIEKATLKAQCSKDGVTGVNFEKTLTVGNDKVFIMKNNAEQNVELWLNGYEIHKIGVSRDPKTVNVKGYASDSHDRRIDHSLTEYFTGADVKAYVVQKADYDKRTLTLGDIIKDKTPVLAENQGCVLHYTENKELKVIDNQFHLFVPDMHDTGNYLHERYGNMLKANAGTIVQPTETIDGKNYTNYILTYKYYQLDKDGNKTGKQMTGDEMFYRVAKGGATGKKNTAYLPLPTSEVMPKNGSAPAKFTFIFIDENDKEDDVVTGVEKIESLVGNTEKAVWYNLNGQKLNGKPQQSGLYIVNGKKVLVK